MLGTAPLGVCTPGGVWALCEGSRAGAGTGPARGVTDSVFNHPAVPMHRTSRSPSPTRAHSERSNPGPHPAQPSRALVSPQRIHPDQRCVSIVCQGEPTQEILDVVARHQAWARQQGHDFSAVAVTDDSLDTAFMLVDAVPQNAIVLRLAGHATQHLNFAEVLRIPLTGSVPHPPLQQPALSADDEAAQPEALADRLSCLPALRPEASAGPHTDSGASAGADRVPTVGAGSLQQWLLENQAALPVDQTRTPVLSLVPQHPPQTMFNPGTTTQAASRTPKGNS